MGGVAVKNRTQSVSCPVDPLDRDHLKIPSDVQGSYTGRTVDPYDDPVQDADDL